MSEPYNKVIYKLAKDNKSDFFTEENWYLLRHIKMIGKKMGMKCGFVHHPGFMSSMYKPLMRSKKMRTNTDIKIAVDLWCSNRVEAEEKYGHISDWDVSSVTDMSELFQYKFYFNDDISHWDVSNVNIMDGMFQSTNVFNQYIGNWDLSNLTDMEGIFRDALAMQPSNAPNFEDAYRHIYGLTHQAID